MPIDINFLPAEDRPKKKPAKRLPERVEFYQPQAEQGVASLASRKSGGWNLLSFFQPKKSAILTKEKAGAAARGNEPPSPDVHQSRQQMLRDIAAENRERHNPPVLPKIKPEQAARPIEKGILTTNEKQNIGMPPVAPAKVIEQKKIKGRLWAKLANALPHFNFKFKFVVPQFKWPRFKFLQAKKARDNAANLFSADAAGGREEKRSVIEPAKQPAPIAKIEKEDGQTATAAKTADNINANFAAGKNSAAPALKNDDQLDTNLVKGQQFAFFNWPRAIKINIAAVVFSLALVGGVWAYLFILSSRPEPLSDLQKQIAAKKQEEINLAAEVEKLSNLRRIAIGAAEILDKHIYWTNFFNLLEANTLADIYFTGFEGSVDGEYSIPAQAKDFAALGQQLQAWQDAKDNNISSVSVDKAELKTQVKSRSNEQGGGEYISFGLNLSVNPGIFRRP